MRKPLTIAAIFLLVLISCKDTSTSSITEETEKVEFIINDKSFYALDTFYIDHYEFKILEINDSSVFLEYDENDFSWGYGKEVLIISGDKKCIYDENIADASHDICFSIEVIRESVVNINCKESYGSGPVDILTGEETSPEDTYHNTYDCNISEYEL